MACLDVSGGSDQHRGWFISYVESSGTGRHIRKRINMVSLWIAKDEKCLNL